MAKEVTNKNYVTILGWMVTDLHLKGNELLIYAVIHGFCQDGDSEFTGSVAYLQSWTGLSYQGTANVLKSLVEKGLLAKVSETRNGVIFCKYQTLYPPKNFGTPSQKSWDNIDNDINALSNDKDNIYINPKPLKFDFRKALLTAGVEPEVSDAWLQVRKAKKAVNTEIAWKAIEKEIALAGQNGHSPDECINLAVVKSWCGFKWSWMENELDSTRSTRSTPGTERNAGKPRRNNMEDLMALGAEMFGPQTTPYDEQ